MVRFLLLFIVFFSNLHLSHADEKKICLKDYIHKADSSYSWKLHSTIENSDKSNTYVLHLTSQIWGEGRITTPLWQHWLTIFVPNTVSHQKALLVSNSRSC